MCYKVLLVSSIKFRQKLSKGRLSKMLFSKRNSCLTAKIAILGEQRSLIALL